jgi:hypothetical protein
MIGRFCRRPALKNMLCEIQVLIHYGLEVRQFAVFERSSGVAPTTARNLLDNCAYGPAIEVAPKTPKTEVNNT